MRPQKVHIYMQYICIYSRQLSRTVLHGSALKCHVNSLLATGTAQAGCSGTVSPGKAEQRQSLLDRPQLESNRVGWAGRGGRWGRGSGKGRLLSQIYHCVCLYLERSWGCFIGGKNFLIALDVGWLLILAMVIIRSRAEGRGGFFLHLQILDTDW